MNEATEVDISANPIAEAIGAAEDIGDPLDGLVEKCAVDAGAAFTPEALERLVESYLALGMPGEAHKAAAVLGRNYPGSEWYHRSYRLIQRHVPQAASQS